LIRPGDEFLFLKIVDAKFSSFESLHNFFRGYCKNDKLLKESEKKYKNELTQFSLFEKLPDNPYLILEDDWLFKPIIHVSDAKTQDKKLKLLYNELFHYLLEKNVLSS
jgi:hypothetical protein